MSIFKSGLSRQSSILILSCPSNSSRDVFAISAFVFAWFFFSWSPDSSSWSFLKSDSEIQDSLSFAGFGWCRDPHTGHSFPSTSFSAKIPALLSSKIRSACSLLSFTSSYLSRTSKNSFWFFLNFFSLFSLSGISPSMTSFKSAKSLDNFSLSFFASINSDGLPLNSLTVSWKDFIFSLRDFSLSFNSASSVLILLSDSSSSFCFFSSSSFCWYFCSSSSILLIACFNLSTSGSCSLAWSNAAFARSAAATALSNSDSFDFICFFARDISSHFFIHSV